MDAEALEKNVKIQSIVARLESRFATDPYLISDVIQKRDGRVFQYVDVVMEGGGVHGIALLGYLYGLEKAGIRFLSVGGTSAGAIAALFLAAAPGRSQERVKTLLPILSDMPLSQFLDGDADAQAFCRLLAAGDLNRKKIKLAWNAIQILDNLFEEFGLNPGLKFIEWLHEHLNNFGVPDLKSLQERVENLPPDLIERDSETPIKDHTLPCRLAIVAADLTTETKVEFPLMAPMYWANTDTLSPANFVRASMSLPFIFQPYTVSGIHQIPDVKKKWDEHCGYTGKIPVKVIFADGGIMSNFPISLFHEKERPLAPTLGIRLSPRSRSFNRIDSVFAYGVAVFNAMRRYADYEFLHKNDDYRQLVGHIDLRKYNWLNFGMTAKEKLALFSHGLAAAEKFLNTFEWPAYKQLRSDLHSRPADASAGQW